MKKKEPQIILTLLGPTASGKTELSLKIAQALSAEIICLDSTTFFKQFNIGSSKPDLLARKAVPHHLVDFLEPEEDFTAFDFVKKTGSVLELLRERHLTPFLVGGSYFYLKSLQNGLFDIPAIDPQLIDQLEMSFENHENPLDSMYQELTSLDPVTAKKTHPRDRYRILRALGIIKVTGKLPSELPLKKPSEDSGQKIWIKYALLKSRHDLTQAITLRTDKMLSQGLIDETKQLMERFPRAKSLSSIGYAECVKYLSQQIDLKQLRNEIIEKTRQLAKRQMTWLRSDPEIRFIDERDEKRIVYEVNQMREALK